MSTRDDHVIVVQYPNNKTIVEHADGTRVTTEMRDVNTEADTSDTVETGW